MLALGWVASCLGWQAAGEGSKAKAGGATFNLRAGDGRAIEAELVATDDMVIGGDMVANGKPAPDLYLLAASTMGEPPARCIVIEDAVRGAMAGRAAGASVIGFAGAAHASPALAEDLRRAGAEVVIEAMHELPAVVRRLIA